MREMCVCKRKSECARVSRRCSGSGIRRGHARARAGMPAAQVAARRSSGSGRDSVSCVEDGEASPHQGRLKSVTLSVPGG
jgi:hypothetical protein